MHISDPCLIMILISQASIHDDLLRPGLYPDILQVQTPDILLTPGQCRVREAKPSMNHYPSLDNYTKPLAALVYSHFARKANVAEKLLLNSASCPVQRKPKT